MRIGICCFLLFASSAFGLSKKPGYVYDPRGSMNFMPFNVQTSGGQKGLPYLGASCQTPIEPYQCMLCNCMREAAGEPLEGKVMVGLVVKTRVESPEWKNDICGVIYEPAQFSWTTHARDRRALPRTMSPAFVECVEATDMTINARGNGIDHYHADYVYPTWAGTCQRHKKIGRHIFYHSCGSKKARTRMHKVPRRTR